MCLKFFLFDQRELNLWFSSVGWFKSLQFFQCCPRSLDFFHELSKAIDGPFHGRSSNVARYHSPSSRRLHESKRSLRASGLWKAGVATQLRGLTKPFGIGSVTTRLSVQDSVMNWSPVQGLVTTFVFVRVPEKLPVELGLLLDITMELCVLNIRGLLTSGEPLGMKTASFLNFISGCLSCDPFDSGDLGVFWHSCLLTFLGPVSLLEIVIILCVLNIRGVSWSAGGFWSNRVLLSLALICGTTSFGNWPWLRIIQVSKSDCQKCWLRYDRKHTSTRKRTGKTGHIHLFDIRN